LASTYRLLINKFLILFLNKEIENNLKYSFNLTLTYRLLMNKFKFYFLNKEIDNGTFEIDDRYCNTVVVFLLLILILN
jgi:hypothetical protein